MTNLEIYNQIFKELFEDEVPETEYKELSYGNAGWDSVMNMDILEMLEQEFNISIDTEDKMKFDSYQNGIELLQKYGIHVES